MFGFYFFDYFWVDFGYGMNDGVWKVCVWRVVWDDKYVFRRAIAIAFDVRWKYGDWNFSGDYGSFFCCCNIGFWFGFIFVCVVFVWCLWLLLSWCCVFFNVIQRARRVRGRTIISRVCVFVFVLVLFIFFCIVEVFVFVF